MPVITLQFDKLKKLIQGNVSTEALVEKIPYLGITLEEVNDESIKIEYNPNRPDFSTSYGIARSLNGILGFEKGSPNYKIEDGKVELFVDKTVEKIRPFIVSLVARGLVLDGEFLEEVISMQEDLHDGIGRHRKKNSIGIHNFDVLTPPIKYTTAMSDFSFIPLGEKEEMTIGEILNKLETGKKYGHIISEFNRYPILIDSVDNVLSFPPIINGDLTRLTTSTRNIFIDITATDLATAEDALAILTATLQDAGAKIESVKIIEDNSTRITPNMNNQKMEVPVELSNKLLGLKLSNLEVTECLERSRISVISEDQRLIASIPRYRVDILHQVDLVEEVAIGYGFEKFTPLSLSSKKAGQSDRKLSLISIMREIMMGLGFIEVMNYNLISSRVQYELTNRKAKSIVKVENPKSLECEILRDVLFPSLLMVLSKNLHEEYPQKIFEISKVFTTDWKTPTGVREEYHLAVAISHSSSNYTEAKSVLTALFSQIQNFDFKTAPTKNSSFIVGRAAAIKISKLKLGIIGEIRPSVLENFKLRNPVSMFEVNLNKIINLLKQKS